MSEPEIHNNGSNKDIQKKIGLRVRAIRKLQKRTIDDLAQASGISKSMISKIENHHALPSIAALVTLASALGVSVSDIIETEEKLAAEFTSASDSEENVAKTGKGYYTFPFASKYPKKSMQPFLMIARKGEVTKHSVTHEGEEFIYVIQGTLNIHIGSEEYEMGPGDSIYFNSLEAHGIMPLTDEVVYLDFFA
ncbi:MAG: XRE family transcriptional regulator [Balneolaceae bacterium]